MTPETILNNIFFGFWYILGEYFILMLACALFIIIILGIAYLLTKK